ncbi:MAG: hypothetical protein A2381_12280 [Bdellovibrionales bacterium RIFOXYB1_FULL_37_110]|nr:MAG: hypothetical protein A2181_02000 [Bdellovibrionales bacterium RIFOXYA1_FULL_38_20]OFZ52273.1 MAG: hypothetical protein A2417_06120 [Bdellovibrionales bacterium RIFOXYC1_FULL_37_79]OFZ57260.1 MAG: hypothetical protein A2381_12280 [Bdellovibrionales bacterium RIFOXYB1_FULL_37_110]OFZ65262.1 MAG: hypothetical protein A2577_04715 [Bdellovibrionales bacterium RIFOXYD1_FULL_36_51]
MFFKKISKFRGKPFSLKDAKNIGIPRSYIRKWLEEDKIEKVSHGFYKINIDEYDKETPLIDAVSIVGKPSVICLLSALEFYNITDQIPKKTWIMVPATKKCSNKRLRLYRTRNPMWDIGIDKHNNYAITSIERTLVECLLFKKILGLPVVMQAIKEALRMKQTTLSDIIKMANKMSVYHRIEGAIEALI